MRKILTFAVLGAIFVLGGSLCIFAQKQNSPVIEYGDQGFGTLVQKIDALANGSQRSDAEIARKLDQILINQDKIIKELEIVKIRASRNR